MRLILSCIVFIAVFKVFGQSQYIPEGFDTAPYSLLSQGNKVMFNVEAGGSAEALRLYKEALNLGLKNNDHTAIARSYYRIGSVYDFIHDLEDATRYYEKSHEIAIAANDSIEIAVAAFAMSVIEIEKDTLNEEQALKWLNEAILYNPERRASFEEIKYFMQLAYVFTISTQPNLAEADSVLNIIPEMINSSAMSYDEKTATYRRYSIVRSTYFEKSGQLDSGLRMLDNLLLEADPENYLLLQQTHLTRHSIFIRMKRYEEALQAYKKAEGYSRLASRERFAKDVAEVRAKYKHEAQLNQIDLQKTNLLKQKRILLALLSYLCWPCFLCLGTGETTKN